MKRFLELAFRPFMAAVWLPCIVVGFIIAAVAAGFAGGVDLFDRWLKKQ